MPPLTVACDESGNEGQNLFGSGSTVFAHASIALSESSATAVLEEVRSRTRSKAPELKSKTILLESNEAVLRWLLKHEELAGSASVHLTEKRYFLVGKVVDLLVEEVMHERGVDVYRNGKARDWALNLYRAGDAELGEQWDALLDAFNAVVWTRKGKERDGVVDRFYIQLLDCYQHSSGRVKNILRLALAARKHADELSEQHDADSEQKYLALDPVIAALGQTARTWHEKRGEPLILVHDNAAALTPSRIKSLIDGLQAPAISTFGLEPIRLVRIETVDSAGDSRVQLADLLAGVGRRVGERALLGERHSALPLLRPLIDPFSLWGDDASWSEMTGGELIS